MYACYIVCILPTLEKNALKTPPAPPPFSPAQLLGFFLQLLPWRKLRGLPALKGKRFYDRLFTPLVTLWYLVFQRLNPDHSLDQALTDARAGGGQRINPKLARGLASNSTCSYSDARQRLPWLFLWQTLRLQAGKILALSPATTLWHDLQLILLDGSTVRLRPYSGLQEDFPVHANQHPKRSYWCLMRVVVGFCGLCGAALDCAMGSCQVSEQVLAYQILLRATGKCLFIGDRNFGIFRLVQAARQAGQHVLFRLTQSRARKLLSRSLRPGQYQVCWIPTRHDQLEPGCSTTPVPGRLLVLDVARKGFRPLRLFLFTTLPDTADYPLEELVRLYGLRWHIELNLRYLKTQMDLVQLEVKSADMARKEWLAGLLAYNLIRAAQLCAALHQGISPLRLSFSAVRRRLEDWLKAYARNPRQLRAHWPELLQQMGRCELPRRRKPRPSEPRAQRHLRSPYAFLFGSRAVARRNLKKYYSKS
jgi:DDE family transposase